MFVEKYATVNKLKVNEEKLFKKTKIINATKKASKCSSQTQDIRY